MLGNDCVVVDYRNANLVDTAERLVNELHAMPIKFMSGELSDATRAMENAVKSKSPSKIVAHSKRLIEDVERHPIQYITSNAVEAAKALKNLVRSYI